MTLHILGSSSRGNCYLLRSETTGEVLILEAGIHFDTVKRALDYNLSAVVGCLVTHEHGDHAGHVRQFLDARLPVYMSSGTIERCRLNAGGLQPHTCQGGTELTIGGFKVLPFNTKHDAAEPLGFLIRHAECGTVLFATDTYYLKYRFPGLNNILIECNYRLDILDANIASGRVAPAVRNRIIKSHMSYHTCLETLQANDLSAVNNIVLIHLSADNSHASEFCSGIAEATGKHTVVAARDMLLPFGVTPY